MPSQRIKIAFLILLGALIVDAGAPAATVLAAPAAVAAPAAYVDTTSQYVQAHPQQFVHAVQPQVAVAQPQFVEAAPAVYAAGPQHASVVTTTHTQKAIAAPAAAAYPLSQPLNYVTYSYAPPVAAVPAAKVVAPIPTYVSAPRKIVKAPVQNRPRPPPPPRDPPPPPPPRPLPSSADEGPRRRDSDDRSPRITIILHAAAVAPRPAGLTYLTGGHATPVLSAAAPAVLSAPQEVVYASAPVQQPLVSVDPGLAIGSYAPQVAILSHGVQPGAVIQQEGGPALASAEVQRPSAPRRPQAPPRSSVTYSDDQRGPPPGPPPPLSSSGGRRGGGGLHHSTFSRAYKLEDRRRGAAPPPPPPPPPPQQSYQEGGGQQLSAGGPGPQEAYGGGQQGGPAPEAYGGQIQQPALLTGFYGFTDPLGLFQRVDYVSDQQGYRTTFNAADPGQQGTQYAQEEPAQLSAQEGGQSPQQYESQEPQQYESQGPQQSYDSSQNARVSASAAGQVAAAKVSVYPAHAPALKYKIYQ